MFSSSVRATLVALIASALAVSATPGLSLKVTGPERVTNVDNLKVVATITNTGDETLKVLNDPASPLSKLPANTFAISHTSGITPTFTGVKVKYVPSVAAAAGAYTILAPGQSVEVEHNLSDAYNFTRSGEGEYAFEANNLFRIVDTTGKVSTLYADAEAHSASVAGRLAVARPTSTLAKRATYNGCTAARQTSLVSAASAAQTYAANALTYLNAHTSSTTRYTTWFGTYTSARHTTVTTHFTNLNSNTYSSYNFDCTCTDSGTYAYVYPDTFGTVYLCGAFWSAPTTGTDSKGGTLIHESSHFTKNGGTQDYVYGQTSAKSLATSNPANAIMNADNHEYFAENNPTLA